MKVTIKNLKVVAYYLIEVYTVHINIKPII